MGNYFRFGVVVFLSLFFAGCASIGGDDDRFSNNPPEHVLKRGKSTETDLTSLYGDPWNIRVLEPREANGERYKSRAARILIYRYVDTNNNNSTGSSIVNMVVSQAMKHFLYYGFTVDKDGIILGWTRQDNPDNIRVVEGPDTSAAQAYVASTGGGGEGMPVAAMGQYAGVAFAYAFSAGGYWLGSKDLEPGEWTKWTSSTGQAFVAEKAFLKKDEKGNEWWRITYNISREKDTPKQLIFEALFAPQRAHLLRLRAQFSGQDAGEIPVTEQQYYFPPAKLTRESIEGAIVGKESVQVGAGKFNANKAVYSVMGAGISEWWLSDKVPGGVVKYLYKAKKEGVPALEMELDSYGKNAKSVLGSF